jgi:hypothetical protein
MIKRTALQGLPAGAHVVWFDQVLPMYRKDSWAVEAVIGMVKSTNHRLFLGSFDTVESSIPGSHSRGTRVLCAGPGGPAGQE